MLSSQQQPQFNHHHQFHQQPLPPMPGAAQFCGSTEITFEPPTHIYIGSGSGFYQQHQQQSVPPSTGSTTTTTSMAQMNNGGFHPQQPPMLYQQNVQQQQQMNIQSNQQQNNNLGASNGLGKTAGNNTNQPGAWFFSPPLLNCQLPPNQQEQDLGSPGSPGLMAPHQLLARFGPRHCTESVEVPSSEHVAEIVGRQGCKIKALRAKTNTYIKTPVRGEEPIFVVTGRQEDVAEARREIECAAEHFTQIRASRRHSQGGCPAPGHVTAYVRVPLRVVGLVVGPKGNTIKRIQQDTHTYIITPSREREPIFEVTGLPQNVEAARREIENHIYQRTGNMPITDPNASIANYDLHAAALQAQQSMQIHSTGGHRPNYGALAVNSSSRNLMQFGGDGTTSPNPYQSKRLNTFLQNSGQFAGSGGRQMINFGGSERGDSSPIHQQQQHSSFGASANNLHMLLGGLELDGNENGQKPTHQPTVGHHLLRSISTQNGGQQQSVVEHQLGIGAITTKSSAFSPWNGNHNIGIGGIGQDHLFGLISTSPSPLFTSSSNGCQSSFSAASLAAGFGGHQQESTGIGNIGMSIGGHRGGHGGLSSVNSSSRDEGLGDSPTNSFGRPQGADYQYQHLMTIWNDLVDQPTGNVGGNEENSKSESEGNKSAGTTPAKEATSVVAVGQTRD